VVLDKLDDKIDKKIKRNANRFPEEFMFQLSKRKSGRLFNF